MAEVEAHAWTFSLHQSQAPVLRRRAGCLADGQAPSTSPGLAKTEFMDVCIANCTWIPAGRAFAQGKRQ